MSAEEIDVVVVGAGQAGLSVSHELAAAGIAHAVLEQADVAASWRGRWDSFCLVTPNRWIRLPGGTYDGADPHGYLPRDETVAYLERYAAGFGAPVRTGVHVGSVHARADGTLSLGTSAGTITARAVVAATGAYQRPHRPAWVAALPPRLAVLDAVDYRNPALLPAGAVLVVGSGQSGCQIAEELHLAGRDVTLACGRAPWIPRRLDGHDALDFLEQTPFLDMSVADLPSPAARLEANFQNSGARGGHDLHFRTLAALGVDLVGHLDQVDGETAYVAADLADSVAFGDSRYRQVRALISASRLAAGLPAPQMPDPPPFYAAVRDRVALRRFGSVILTAGYRPAYQDWIAHPEAFDAMGFPLHSDGASTVVPGLSFVGVHFLRRRKSSLLLGVGDDARVVAERIATSS